MFIAVVFSSFPIRSEGNQRQEWHSVTLDNDLFLGDDSGYSNGLYYSLYNASQNEGVEHPLLLAPTIWSYNSNESPKLSFNALTFGHIIVTPDDITQTSEQPNDIPYGGLLFLHRAHIADFGGYADKMSTTIGLLGPSSRADRVQTSIHRITGSDIPQGWDNQLKDELVFQFSRGRAWRIWSSQQDNSDFILGVDSKFGTLETSIGAGAMFRVGREIEQSFSSVLLNDDRTSNPVNVNDGWYFYTGVGLSYTWQLIFLDGNTFRESASVEYEPLQLTGILGYTYAWNNFSMTIAINGIDLLKKNSSLPDRKSYGSMTWLWRLD
ncbi:lipid A deacylase LpxR family protein [Pleionea sediminis]|uniref:lipid A deacylase LpxR family protein n=1 Tax=Pleionea sediminis TaxID=2569479 RepID=UPI0013DE3437|nr:lipid A deacylase LpxR family protein [Pleionea sediminis]